MASGPPARSAGAGIGSRAVPRLLDVGAVPAGAAAGAAATAATATAAADEAAARALMAGARWHVAGRPSDAAQGGTTAGEQGNGPMKVARDGGDEVVVRAEPNEPDPERVMRIKMYTKWAVIRMKWLYSFYSILVVDRAATIPAERAHTRTRKSPRSYGNDIHSVECTRCLHWVETSAR